MKKGKGKREEGTAKRGEGRENAECGESARAKRTHRPRKQKGGRELRSMNYELRKGKTRRVHNPRSKLGRREELSRLSVGSLQLSVACLAATRRGARVNCDMRANHESRTTDRQAHRRHKSSGAKRTHRVASQRPQSRKAGRCLDRRMVGAGVQAGNAAIFVGATNAVHLALGEIRRDPRTARDRTTRNG